MFCQKILRICLFTATLNVLNILTLNGQTINEISIEEVLSIGQHENEEFYQLAGICVDDSENIYLSDMIDQSLHKFNSQGKRVLKLTPESKVKPVPIQKMVYNNDKIYIVRQGFPGIEILNRYFSRIGFIKYPNPVSSFCFIDSTHLLVLPFKIFSSNHFSLITLDGQEYAKIEYNIMNEKGLQNQITFKIMDGESIVFAYLFSDCVAKIDFSSKLIWKEQFYKGIKTETKSLMGISLPQNTFFVDIQSDKFKNIFVLLGHYSSLKNMQILILNESGDEKQRLDLPFSTHMIYIDHNNYLYTRALKGTSLKKFKIIYH